MKIRLGFGFAALLVAAPLFAADIDGKWIVTVEDSSITFDLKSDGPTITGTVVMKGGDLGLSTPPVRVTGTILGGKDVVLIHQMPTGIQPGSRWVEISYQGTLKGDELDLVTKVELEPGTKAGQTSGPSRQVKTQTSSSLSSKWR